MSRKQCLTVPLSTSPTLLPVNTHLPVNLFNLNMFGRQGVDTAVKKFGAGKENIGGLGDKRWELEEERRAEVL
jgi:hypothetical protein